MIKTCVRLEQLEHNHQFEPERNNGIINQKLSLKELTIISQRFELGSQNCALSEWSSFVIVRSFPLLIING